MENLKTKFEANSRSKKNLLQMRISALKRRVDGKSKFFKVSRGRRLKSPNFTNQSFFSRRKGGVKICRKQDCFSLTQRLRGVKRVLQRSSKCTRAIAKSPIPRCNPRMLLNHSGLDFNHQNKRYMDIIKKAQDALSTSSRGFDSPTVLQKFLSDRESLNHKDKDSDQSFTSVCQDSCNSFDSKKDFEVERMKSLNLVVRPSTFSKLNMSQAN
ncbi:unnamed protein product [Moneuplotes crassus]|uniref:Uncharacterized protein n=1 Tax=Euplotes crassus TaxID=5936 RepID=A0AAD1Y8W6_EUPCR|nr:unnamed protein product [Moneuplotes crassus]